MILLSKNRRLLAAIGLVLFGLAGLAVSQTNISNSPNWFSSCPRVAVDPSGNVHVVWAEFYTWTNSPQVPTSGDAFYSRLDAGTGQWSAPANLSNTGQVKSYEWYVVGIDTDPYGNVYVVYVNGTQLMLRVFSGGAWGAPFLVGTGPGAGGVDSARIAADAQGNIYICWWDNDWGIVYSRARVGGAWEGVVQLSKPVRSKFPEIAVGPNLVYCVFMDAQTGYSYQAVYTVRARTYGAVWSAPKRVSSSSEPEEHPAVEVDSADVAHVIYTPWFASDGTRSVRYVSGTAAGWSAPLDIGSRGGVHYPSIGLRGNNLYPVWKYDLGKVFANERKAGVWSGEFAVPGSSHCDLPDVAVSPSQDKVYYVWDNGSPQDIYIGVKTQYVAATDAAHHAVADFDGDKRVEVAVDFGSSGLWLANDNGWSQLSTSNPQDLLPLDSTGDGTAELVADYGTSGLWIMVGGTWHKISSLNPEALAAGSLNGAVGDELAVDFGSSGLWLWDGSGWTQLSSVNPAALAAGDVDGDGTDELAAGFSSLGIWLWNSGTWAQLSRSIPDILLAGNMDGSGGDELVADLGGLGVWVLNGANWIKLSPADAEGLVLGDADGNGTEDLLGDFGEWGLYLWINNGWVELSGYDPDRVIAADVDGDGRDEPAADFGPFGLWLCDETGWALLSYANAENILSGDADGNGSEELLVDFGPLGLWGWYGGAWYQISTQNPD